MLEIFLLVCLARKLGNNAEAKGHGRFGYQLMLWLFWFFGEVGGAVVGAMVSASGVRGEPNKLAIYGFALVGAILGALLAFGLVEMLPNHNDVGVRRRSRSRSYLDRDFADYDDDYRTSRAAESDPSPREERIRRLLDSRWPDDR